MLLKRLYDSRSPNPGHIYNFFSGTGGIMPGPGNKPRPYRLRTTHDTAKLNPLFIVQGVSKTNPVIIKPRPRPAQKIRTSKLNLSVISSVTLF